LFPIKEPTVILKNSVFIASVNFTILWKIIFTWAKTYGDEVGVRFKYFTVSFGSELVTEILVLFERE